MNDSNPTGMSGLHISPIMMEKPSPQSLAEALAVLGADSKELELIQFTLQSYFQATFGVEFALYGYVWVVNLPSNKGIRDNRADFTSHNFTDCVLWLLNRFATTDTRHVE